MTKNSNRYRELVDYYLQYALLIDTIVIGCLWLLNSKLSLFDFILKSKTEHITIIENIIGASISLAGFILASLTIIASIRSNVLNKKPKNSETPLELLFSVGIYKAIVKVFKIAIIELVLCFIISYIITLSSANLNNYFVFKSLIVLIYLLSVSTIRSLFVLFLLIDSEKK
ncbi:hypothetical protein NH341_00150 [Tenacibaculum sp. XPcli2-G]|uniref:hypothetical protein n=1 Tax=Tenacibaculum sp. XPcli2-G TaxID=2954503 RepID=UPI002097E7F0|nr:hypothetical protein [Tenacibaculum sp. XPcli2-G]MCO7183823.1 hypothetical protein [Tenacibaculum sp. XPcli2-G]